MAVHFQVICFLAVLIVSTTRGYSRQDVDRFAEEIEEFQREALKYQFPTDSSSYVEGNEELDENDCTFGGHFDFIVVGGGASGTVLANRLSEVREWDILLLEAGGFENDLTDVPYIYNYLVASEYNWGYNSIRNKDFGGYINNSMVFSTGKVIGGSSVINNMFYARGNAEDFNKWAALGNHGWSYKDVLPYFKKSERVDFPGAELAYHGTHGTLRVEHSRYVNNITQSFLDAQAELGRKILDYNGKDQLGFSVVQLMQINGVRDSGSKAFWEPAHHRKNLDTCIHSLVTKIFITKKTKKAIGVQYIKHGRCYNVFAHKEVLISAGALNSPQILMLSGIGPKRHLEEKGIKVVQDLPVGDNMWNHMIYGLQSFSVNYTYPEETLQDQVAQYFNGYGLLTTPGGLQALGFCNTQDNSNVPDVEYMLATNPPGLSPYEYYEKTLRYTRETFKNIIIPQSNLTNFYVFVVQMHSKSRGTVRLQSKSPLDFPLFDPNYFSDPEDVNTFVRAFRDMEKMINTPAMRKMDAKLVKVTLPACERYTYDSDEYWGCMVKNLGQMLHHYAGTCKMGPHTDKTAVVDPLLQVYGIRNLRVIDCSIMPTTISGNTVAAAYMIAEKGADLIKEKYLHRR